MEKIAELEKRVAVLEDGILQLLKGLNTVIIAVAPVLMKSDVSAARSLNSLNSELNGIHIKLISQRRK